ncbi:hypothetical protein [Botrimarina sp.]|uniref:hypothetical protein n=1 Tax=Botrimarina sp. TaxID=2795802 RepID=UPI0032EB091A
MPQYRVNEEAVRHAEELIDKQQYVLDSDWSDAQASTDEENDFLDDHSWQEYARWFLAVDPDATKHTKSRYGFDYGDFRRVHRSALIAAKQRAGSSHHPDIQKAADRLLEKLDRVKA